MKRKRGRPPGKKFPQPNNIFKGMWNATFGKLGASEAMHVVMMCPYREVSRIQNVPVGKLSKAKKRALELRCTSFSLLRNWGLTIIKRHLAIYFLPPEGEAVKRLHALRIPISLPWSLSQRNIEK
jgi:hypothetical protein